MLLTEDIKNRWEKMINNPDLPQIKCPHKRRVTARLLENQELWLKQNMLAEGTQTSNMDIVDPVLISLVRRTQPNLIAHDICGTQAMNGPTGLIFALRAIGSANPTGAPLGSPGDARDGFENPGNEVADWQANGYATDELFYNEPDTSKSGTGTHSPGSPDYTVGTGMSTSTAENLGRGLSGDAEFGEVSFTIEKVSVEAKARALRAEYTLELQQDLKSVHGLDAENELSNILSTEILAEINRQIVGTVRRVAKLGTAAVTYTNGEMDLDSAGDIVTGAAGVWNMDTNSDGRWQNEKFMSLLYKIEQEANKIAKETRRGRGNVLIVSSNVGSALNLAGKLVYAPSAESDLEVDDTGNLFAGMLLGRYKVFIDPYLTYDEVIVGYKGSTQYDAGMFYCPYVPLEKLKAVSPVTFQPAMAMKTRYGLVQNPFTNLTLNSNHYYRKFRIVGLTG